MGKYGLAKNILNTVIDKAQVPMISNRRFVDETATKNVLTAMGAACRAINMSKYALATSIIAMQMEKMPHVVDEEVTKSMLSAIGTAHRAVYSKLNCYLVFPLLRCFLVLAARSFWVFHYLYNTSG